MTHINYGGRQPNAWRDMPCETCQATGSVTHETLEQRAAGKRLRDLRVHETRWSQRQMAEHLGQDVVQVSRWEQGKDAAPSWVVAAYEACAGVGWG